MDSGKKTFEVMLDRIEEDMAIVILPGEKDSISCPANLLPENAKESDVIKITIEVDEERTKQVKEETKQLLFDLITRQEK